VVAHPLQRGNRHYRLLVFVSIEQSLRHNEKEAWQKLVRVLNHEVRNSLTPIYSMAQSLQELPKNSQSDLQTTMLNVIEKRAEHLLEFVASYSKLSQIPSAKFASVCTNEIAKRCEALFPNVDIINEHNGNIECDIEQLEQALLNLVKNANEANSAAHTSGVTIRISKTNQWQIAIEDNGIGVDLNDNLFVPFYSTKPEGSGIGLVLSRELIRNQSGELILTNKPHEQGAIATITFAN
jgi:signal transduction histidine kinase